jgi:hypothetical protein
MRSVATTHGSARDARPPQMARYPSLPAARHAFVSGFVMAAGTVLGGFSAIARRTGFSESWETTFGQSSHGPIWLAVYRSDEPTHRALEGTHPMELRSDPGVETHHPDEPAATDPSQP